MYDKQRVLIYLLEKDNKKIELAKKYYNIFRFTHNKKKEKTTTLRRDVLFDKGIKRYIRISENRKVPVSLNIGLVLDEWVRWMGNKGIQLSEVLGVYDLDKLKKLFIKYRIQIFNETKIFCKDAPSLFGFINFSLALFLLKTSKYTLEDGPDFTPNPDGSDAEEYDNFNFGYNLKHFLLFVYEKEPFFVKKEKFEAAFFHSDNGYCNDEEYYDYKKRFEEKDINFIKGRIFEIISKIGESGVVCYRENPKPHWLLVEVGGVKDIVGNLFKYGINVLESNKHPKLKEHFIYFEEIKKELFFINKIEKFFI